MERRKFIVSSSGLIAGVALLPSVAMASNRRSQIFSLPKFENHIRHGLLSNSTQNTSCKEIKWISGISRNRFFENGHSPHINDLFEISLQLNDDQVTFTKSKDELWILGEEIKKIRAEDNTLVEVYQNKEIQVYVLKGKSQGLRDATMKEMLFIPFNGEYYSESQKFTQDQAVLIENGRLDQNHETNELTLIIINNG